MGTHITSPQSNSTDIEKAMSLSCLLGFSKFEGSKCVQEVQCIQDN